VEADEQNDAMYLNAVEHATALQEKFATSLNYNTKFN